MGVLVQSWPTMDSYALFRNKEKSGAVMSTSSRKAYGDIFQTYPDAQNKDNEALRNFFSASTERGEGVLVNTVNTFKALCEFADFETTQEVEVGVKPSVLPTPKAQET